jgi:trimeric autotransporter adhesin
MADLKISALPASTTPLAGTEVLPLVQGGQTKQVSVANLTLGRAVSLLSVTSTNDATLNNVKVGLGGGNVEGNTVVGFGAGLNNTSGTNLTAIGYQAGGSNTTAANLTAVGRQAMNLSNGNDNSALGYRAGRNCIGGANTIVGSQAAQSITGSNNTAIGVISLLATTSGANNTGLGFGTLQANTTASNNTAAGYQAGLANTIGASNVFLGGNAGDNLTTGSFNVYIGQIAKASAVAATGEIVVGYNLTGKGDNTAFIGGSSGAYNGNNSAAWAVVSDARIKKNVTSLTSGLNVISALRPVEFDYIENDKHDIGFIAQEYQAVLPAQVAESAEGMLSLNQNLVPYLVKALQELNEKFDAYVAAHSKA